MSDPKPSKRLAYETPCGHAVNRFNDTDPKNLYMKAEREGAEYIHHYLIQISPVRPSELALIYIDPEEYLIDWASIPTFELLSSKVYKKPNIGHIFNNDNGTFLKVIEDPKSQKMFAFININTGEVKRRQERNINTVYDSWRTIKIF
jgi:hypothetical protein